MLYFNYVVCMCDWAKQLVKITGELLSNELNESYAKTNQELQKLKDEDTKMWEDFDLMFKVKDD